jgi:integrase
MARRRIPIGQHGEISYDSPDPQANSKTKVRARTRVRDHDGVLRAVTASGPSREAARHTLLEDLRLRFHYGAALGADGITPTTKINTVVAEWLREVELRRLSTSTMRIYRSSARLHINPYMGEWLIREATTRRVDRVIKDHIAKGLDSQALRKHLNQVFDLAVRHDALPSNPVASVAKVRRGRQPQRIVEGAAQVAEIRALVQRWEAEDRPGPKATHDLYLFVMLLGVTGARPGELLAVRWSDVNLLAERPDLAITGTIKQETGLGIYRQHTPKSPTSVRRVELPASVVALLMDRKVNQSGPNPIDAIFPSRVGTWQAPTNMRRRWVSATEGTKFQWVTFKTFRKSVATLIANEYDIRTAQHQLGHASASTTETFYDAGAPDAPRVAETLQKFLEDSEPRRT